MMIHFVTHSHMAPKAVQTPRVSLNRIYTMLFPCVQHYYSDYYAASYQLLSSILLILRLSFPQPICSLQTFLAVLICVPVNIFYETRSFTARNYLHWPDSAQNDAYQDEGPHERLWSSE